MAIEERGAILVVDDEEYIRRLAVRTLEKYGYQCTQAASGAEALQLLAHAEFELLISDIMMPEMTGLELLDAVRRLHPAVAIIMLTGVDSQETGIRALEMGAYNYLIKPFIPNALLINVINALRRRELEISRDDYERRLEVEVRERTLDIRRREEEITLHLVTASEYRDKNTGDHIRRTALFAAALANALGWPEEQVELLRLAATMHDIGKIGISDDILLKEGGFSPEEFELMKQHTTIGAGILSGSDIPIMRLAGEVALFHHERWDGQGYPRGLAGDDIPESARIVAVADVYDALLSSRIYHTAFPESDAIPMMVAEKGLHFEPRIIDCLCEIVEELRTIRQGAAIKSL